MRYYSHTPSLEQKGNLFTMTQDQMLLEALDTAGKPVSISSETGAVRSIEDRIQKIRTDEISQTRGSCQSGYSTWGN